MYVVAGVTGHTGSAAAQKLLERGVPVRVIVRNEAKGTSWAAKGAEVAVADLDDTVALAKAFAGAEGAYVLNPPAYASADPFGRAAAIAESIASAVGTAGLPRLAVLSSVGSQHESGTGIIATTHVWEERLRNSAPAVVFVRASYFMENWAPLIGIAGATGNLPSFLAPLDRAIPMVACADIGRVAAEALLEEWTGPRVIELEGPARYSPIDVAAAFSNSLETTVTPTEVPRAQWSSFMGMGGIPSSAIPHVIAMFEGINNGVVDFEGAGASHIQGRTTLDQVVDILARM